MKYHDNVVSITDAIKPKMVALTVSETSIDRINDLESLLSSIQNSLKSGQDLNNKLARQEIIRSIDWCLYD